MKCNTQLILKFEGHDIKEELEQQGVVAMARGWASPVEEASLAYKDVADVVRVSENAGPSKNVVRLRPMGVIKDSGAGQLDPAPLVRELRV